MITASKDNSPFKRTDMKTIVRKPDQRNTAKSQRVTRIERGMRPREAVHTRQTARRAKH